jgi:hypothetical protein
MVCSRGPLRSCLSAAHTKHRNRCRFIHDSPRRKCTSFSWPLVLPHERLSAICWRLSGFSVEAGCTDGVYPGINDWIKPVLPVDEDPLWGNTPKTMALSETARTAAKLGTFPGPCVLCRHYVCNYSHGRGLHYPIYQQPASLNNRV